MRNFSIIVGLLLQTFSAAAQYTTALAPAESEVLLGVQSSRFKSDSLEADPIAALSVGFRTTAKLTDLYFLRATGRFSTRGYNTRTLNGRLRNRYVDAEINVLRELLPGLRAEVGLAAHFLFQSSFRYNSPVFGFQEVNTTPKNWSTFADGLIGLEIRLEEKLALGIRYYPAVSQRQGPGLLAQMAVSLDDTWSSGIKAAEREEAYQNILDLKNGVLLVRLKRLDKSVNALIRMGEPLKAEEFGRKIAAQNRDLMRAFEQEFNFCPVYFFYSESSDSIRKSNYSVLFDQRGEPVELPSNFPNVFIADTGPLQADTSTHFYDYELVSDGNFSRKRIKRVYAGQAMGFGAICIKDQQFVNLKNPFPYYVKTYGNYVFLRKPSKIVWLLNQKLFDYYARIRR